MKFNAGSSVALAGCGNGSALGSRVFFGELDEFGAQPNPSEPNRTQPATQPNPAKSSPDSAGFGRARLGSAGAEFVVFPKGPP